MCNYIIRPRQNHADAATDAAIKTLFAASARKLLANNAAARINFAKIALRQVLAHPGIATGPLHLVTITPARCAHPINDGGPGTRQTKATRRQLSPAAVFDVTALQQIARQGMGEIPFLGMVEAALFLKWGPDGWSFTDWISWHCHLLTWGKTEGELSAQLEPLRRRHHSMRARVSPVHIKPVPQADVTRQLLYILKAPQKFSRVGRFSKVGPTGRTKMVGAPGLRIKKDDLRTGQRIRMLDVIGERRLDQLLFGNNAGTALARSIRLEARRFASSRRGRFACVTDNEAE
ncbi:hypothetical protein [Methylobacterium sp. SI9]|uniref:hypothetical protein n=1 Tax=Methylobacterium guangdongense TaxID=3138811 RepID=UPI00313CC1BA